MSGRRPLSELTLGEADSFLENLICQTQGSGGGLYLIRNWGIFKTKHVSVASSLDRGKGEAVSDEDRALQVAGKLKTTHDVYNAGYGLLSNFDVGSTVSQLEPEAVMEATCVVLSAASNVASLKFPDMTMYKVLASLQRIEGKLGY